MRAYPVVSRGPAAMRQFGFSLPELMVVLAVAAVTLSLAVPNFRSFMQNSRLTSAANDLLVSMHMARTEAVKRQLPVAVCATTNPDAAVPTCSSGDFEAWVVWVDANNNWVPDNNANEPVLERHEPVHDSLNVRVSADEDSRIKYLPSGFASLASGGFTPTARVALCDERGLDAVNAGEAAARAVLVTVTGRARVTRDASEIEDALSAMNVTCP